MKQVNDTPDVNNGTYKSLNEAAEAAQARFGNLISLLGKYGEIGCGLFYDSRGCGYEPGTFTGGDSYVNIPVYSRDIGLWHAHPVGDSNDTLSGHSDNVDLLFRNGVTPPFTYYTTLVVHGHQELWAQVYNSRVDTAGVQPLEILP